MERKNEEGVICLSGFTFQIKVFFYYLLHLQENGELGFEVLDDISMANYKQNDLDKSSYSFSTNLILNESNTVIQVKRSEISSNTFKGILYNWLIIEFHENNIDSYLIYSEKENKVNESFLNDCKKIYDEILKSNKKSTANISKVKQLYKDDFALFEKKYNSIITKMKIFDSFNVDDKIYEEYKTILRRTKPTEEIYKSRIEELLKTIQFNLLNNINRRKVYICSYEEFLNYVEEVCKNINEDEFEPNYYVFKETNTLDMDQIRPTREYKQLKHCSENEKFISRHIMYGLYYEDFRNTSLERNKTMKINSIENRAFDSYQDVVEKLKIDGKDEPRNRLDGCKKENNSYVKTEETKYGSLIFMTREAEVENQLSWKEDEADDE